MGTLYIDRKGYHIRLDGDALAFYVNDKREGIVPLKLLSRVIIAGSNTIETNVLHRLADNGATVIFLSGKRLRFRGILHGRLHNNGMLRVAQYEKSKDDGFSLQYSRNIVMKKIDGQKTLLTEILDKKPHIRMDVTRAVETMENILSNIVESRYIDAIRGYEGAAANAYFSTFTKAFPESLNFKNRNKRPPKDPVNAMLSLCYTMLHYEALCEIQIIGLDPVIGFYHRFDYGRDSLASDIIEPYRPHADRFVWEIFRERKFTDRDFIEENGGVYLKKEARKDFYPLYEEWALNIRAEIRKDLRQLLERLTDGQNTLSDRKEGT